MRSTFSLLPYINRGKARADGTTAVLCRITIDGKQTVISTGIYCRPEDWNGRNAVQAPATDKKGTGNDVSSLFPSGKDDRHSFRKTAYGNTCV